MKRRFCYLVVCVILAMGCKQEKKQTEDPLAYALITGYIKNRQIYPRQKSLKVIIPSFRNSQTIQECEIKPDHTFSFRFQPLALRDISIETFIPSILIRPGDSLHIELDFANLDKVEFSGSAGKLNQDLYTFTDGGGYYLAQHTGTDDRMMPPAAFRKMLEQQRQERVNRCTEFIQKYGAEPDLKKWIEKGLEVEYLTLLYDYGLSHPYLTGDSLSDAFYDFAVRAEDLFTTDVIHSGLFELSLNMLYSRPEEIKRLEDLMGTTRNKVLGQFLVAGTLDEDLSCHEVSRFEQNRDFFDREITLPVLRESLLQKYKDKKAYLANPKPLSGRMLYGTDRENGLAPMTESGMKKLQDVVRKNAGKVMLVNFWGGCSAALTELKPLSELVNEYQGKEVEFISITADVPLTRTWNRKYDLGDQSYLWEGEDIRQIMRSWHVNWSPYYLLIDKNGTIVDYGTHIRPGSAKTKEKIDRLLKE